MPSAPKVHRIEVRPRPDRDDPKARAVRQQAAAAGVPLAAVHTARVYLIQADLSADQLRTVSERLLTDPVTETATIGATPAPPAMQLVEVHPLPGVMDPVAQSVQEAIRDLVGVEPVVSTGWRYDLAADGDAGRSLDASRAADLARRLFANPVIHAIHTAPFQPDRLPEGAEHDFEIRRIAIRNLTDEELTKLSREAHLFLSLDEMRAIQAEFRRLDREPTDIELETLAQTWSEHCVHKTLKSKVRYRNEGGGSDPIDWSNRPGHAVQPDGSVTIDNLLKSTVAAATFELIDAGLDWTLSVFKDNSGVVALDDRWGVNIKVETHNRPSAIEPYGGAATGAGGCIRDVIGTGLGARPIASTDVFCVAFPDRWTESAATPEAAQLPPGTLHPRRILTDVVAGVRDYGNRMGIPTVSGAIAFDDRYVGNPLVYCGCVGLIPRDLVKGAATPGDRVIALGGRTGRDGIHGATFSSAGLESTAATEFAHAVQIGNAIEERRLLEAILRARDEHGKPLFTAITDCGAGGFSSAVGEMGGELGAEVHLERAPLKYAGLSYTEIWISEAQERMILAVPPGNLDALRRICEEEHVELADLGHFGTPEREIVLNFRGREVGRLSTHFLHEGLPQPVRDAVWRGAKPERQARADASTTPTSVSQRRRAIAPALRRLLSHPNIASKHWVIRQYDHEVQGNTVLKPFVGPLNRAASDAAVLEPIAGSGRGIAIAQGLQTGVGDPAVGGDPYLMALAAIDECVRNLVCVGADPSRIAILDNFCWPSCAVPENLGALVRAAEGCYDGAKAYGTPFVSGKDSLNNQLRYTDPATGQERVIEIPPTLLITGLGLVPSLDRVVTMDAKEPGNVLILVGSNSASMGGSHYAALAAADASLPAPPDLSVPSTDLSLGPRAAAAVHSLIGAGLVRSAHDVSDGGVLCAIAEMLIAGAGGNVAIGAQLDLSEVHDDPLAAAFGEGPSRYVLEVRPSDLPLVEAKLDGVPWARIGDLVANDRLRWLDARLDERVETLTKVWMSPLDW